MVISINGARSTGYLYGKNSPSSLPKKLLWDDQRPERVPSKAFQENKGKYPQDLGVDKNTLHCP